MRNFIVAFGLVLSPLALITTSTPSAMAQETIRSERVTFRPGTSSTVITRTIRGRETVDFVVSAREGQQLVASLSSKNSSVFFNIIAPGETDVAFYVGDTYPSTNRFSGPVPRTGDLKFRVYLNRAVARRGGVAAFRLDIAVTGAGGSATQLPSAPPSGGHATHLPATPPSGGHATHLPGDATLPGDRFHASGPVRCETYANGPVVQCEFGVVRRGGGSGIVTLIRPDGGRRTVTWHQGIPIAYDKSQADRSELSWTRQGDETIVVIGAERYFVPDAVIYGG